MSTQTDIFRHLVRKRLGDPPVCLPPDASVRELVERMDSERATSAVIVDHGGRPAGIITEQDVTRKIALRLAPDARVSDIMTTPVVTVERSDQLYHAVAFMRRRNLRHIPVLNEEGLVCGMLSLSEALGFLSEQTMGLIDTLTHEASLDGLKQIKAAQVELAEALFNDNVPVPEVQSLLSDINGDIHARILRRHLDEMESEKAWGAPPVAFSLIILGSGGRGENFLFPDQDNAFILDDYADADHSRIDPFFVELAQRMTKDLDAVGLMLCRGYIMATNPVWRKTRTQWRHQVAYWMRSRTPATLRYCDIFFDFAHGFGRADHSAQLREYVTQMGTRNPGFLKDMFAIQEEHNVALGWFNRLMTERDDDGHNGMINLKYNGTLPLVEAVRLLALKYGIATTSTLGRLKGLRQCDAIDDDSHDYLTGGLNHLTGLLLRQQLKDFKAGKKVTNFVPKNSLSKRERDYLADCFAAIQDFRGRLSSEFSGEF